MSTDEGAVVRIGLSALRVVGLVARPFGGRRCRLASRFRPVQSSRVFVEQALDLPIPPKIAYSPQKNNTETSQQAAKEAVE